MSLSRAGRTDRQEAYALIDLFVRLYKKEYGTVPLRMNRHALAHGFEALWKDYGEQAKDIVEFYLDNYKEPSPFEFVYKYGDVAVEMEERRLDEEERRQAYLRTIERLKERNKGVGSG